MKIPLLSSDQVGRSRVSRVHTKKVMQQHASKKDS